MNSTHYWMTGRDARNEGQILLQSDDRSCSSRVRSDNPTTVELAHAEFSHYDTCEGKSVYGGARCSGTRRIKEVGVFDDGEGQPLCGRVRAVGAIEAMSIATGVVERRKDPEKREYLGQN